MRSRAHGRTFALYLILLGLASGFEGEARQSGLSNAQCIDDGELTADIFGAVETRLEWRDDALECDGMPRPHGKGARLRFAGPATSKGETLELAFIIALPDLEKGSSGEELPAGVTLIEEKAGRFFTTPESPACWADIEQQDPVVGDAPPRADPQYRIEGLLYCVSPLAEVNGSSSITLTDLRFAGRLSWQTPK